MVSKIKVESVFSSEIKPPVKAVNDIQGGNMSFKAS